MEDWLVHHRHDHQRPTSNEQKRRDDRSSKYALFENAADRVVEIHLAKLAMVEVVAVGRLLPRQQHN